MYPKSENLSSFQVLLLLHRYNTRCRYPGKTDFSSYLFLVSVCVYIYIYIYIYGIPVHVVVKLFA